MSATKVLTEALLKNIMTDVIADRGMIGDVDLNSILSPGIYQIDNSTHLPQGMNPWSYLVVFCSGSGIIHLGVDVGRGALYFRAKWSSQATWTNWWKVTGTAVT